MMMGYGKMGPQVKRIVLMLLSLLMPTILSVGAASADRESIITHSFSFDDPMSWADNISPWGLKGVQNWNIAEGGRPGKALRISAADWKQPVSFEVRTLQFNHKPGTTARISFDIRATCAPPGSRFIVRYFDGYSGAFPFIKVADDLFAPFPPPILDSADSKVSNRWRHVDHRTGPLKNTVLTIAIIVQQPASESDDVDEEYIEYYLDNLKVEVTPLDKLMDLGFDWHGVSGASTIQFRHNTRAANADWCDYADQEDVVTPEGTVHYTLLHWRSSSTYPDPGWNCEIAHKDCAPEVGGVSAIGLRAGGSAVSWGVRQTVAYSALGLSPEATGWIRVSIKMTNADWDVFRVSRVQLGVDPYGGVITQKAIWGDEYDTNYYREGWKTASLEFDRPAGAEAFTIYFRHRDSKPGRSEDHPTLPEVMSNGSPKSISAYADWVVVELIKDNDSK